MIKLTKTSSTTWNGIGFGTSAADWVVVGHEHIAIRKLGMNWFAVDTSEYALIAGRKVTKKIAKADTKSDLLKKLETQIADNKNSVA